ncbi:MAG: serine/threonine-protein kinase [Acidobacteriota bacterium]|nr:serine/threonine-protein kinase [Acidobacteriota bacterium]
MTRVMEGRAGAATNRLQLSEDDASHLDEMVAAIEKKFIDGMIGRRFGDFYVVEHLATGGMSMIFLTKNGRGEQAALKLIQPGQTGSLQLKRFMRELAILETMNHPNVAALYHRGITDDGLPYAVMEYVDGRPLDRFCREERLNLPQRLGLFLQLCSGTAYVHRKGVIHRDLKPDNVLVTRDGRVKVVDFGIARTDRNADSPRLTQPGMQPMTLGYASPEQIAGQPITVAGDIYALGVILYQLITGYHPFLRPQSPCLDLERAVLELTPLKPSRVVDLLGPGKGLSPEDLHDKSLVSGLDAVAQKALQREPGRRFRDVPEMAAALSDLNRKRGYAGRIILSSLGSFKRPKRIMRDGLLATTCLAVGFAACLWMDAGGRANAETVEAYATFDNFHDPTSSHFGHCLIESQ